MICPLLESIEITDRVVEKMEYFVIRWRAKSHMGLVDEMRDFFNETFWNMSNIIHLDEENYALFNDDRKFILRAERSMDNIISIWRDREIKMASARVMTRLRSTV